MLIYYTFPVRSLAGFPTCHPGLVTRGISEGFCPALDSTRGRLPGLQQCHPHPLCTLEPQCVQGAQLQHSSGPSCSTVRVPLKPFPHICPTPSFLICSSSVSFSSHSYEHHHLKVVSSAMWALGPALLTGVPPTRLSVLTALSSSPDASLDRHASWGGGWFLTLSP